MTKGAVFVFAVLALFGSGRLQAVEPPHWSGQSIQIDCTSQCHVAHHSLGQNLNSTTSNVNLCLSCHNASGLAKDLPFTIADRAVPGESGRSHAFDVSATNSAAGALPPTDGEMDLRLPGGNIICSTCHDQHNSQAAFGGTPRVSTATKVVANGGTGVLTSGGVFSGPEGLWYLVEIVDSGDETSATFHYSKDNGISFFGWNGTSWEPQNANGRTVGSDLNLDNGVTVSFSAGTYVAGERWEFSAAYPFLRSALSAGGSGTNDLCWHCHQSWVNTTADVRTYSQGVKRSHPNGIAYPAADPDDGFHDIPLDGNGAAQGSGGADSNATNNLRLFANNVECLTCHGVHFVDSNTQTVDMP